MKKYLSLILSASLTVSALASTTVFAEGSESEIPTIDNMVVLGDSIARGYGLGDDQFNYADICADYFGANLDNFAEDGLDTFELLDMLKNPTDEQKESFSNSEVFIVSIGGNDMMHYGIKQILDFAAKNDLLKEGYTAENIPESPHYMGTKHIDMLDFQALKDFANAGLANQLAINTELSAFSQNLRLSEGSNAYGENQGIIHNEIMANIQEISDLLKEYNPDAQVIVQTVYQPLQLDPEYVASYDSGYATMLSTFRASLNTIMDTFRDELYTIDGIEVIDVLQTFTALNDLDESNNANPGYAHYFTNMQEETTTESGQKVMDFHPNQKGHLAIASLLLGSIKVKDAETGEMVSPAPAPQKIDPETGEVIPTLFSKVYDSIEDIADYPPLAMEELVSNVEEYVVPGDVNHDGEINAIDASFILGEYARLSTNPEEPSAIDEEGLKMADINHDNEINAVDATFASMYYAYLATLQEGEEALNIFGYMHTLYLD